MIKKVTPDGCFVSYKIFMDLLYKYNLDNVKSMKLMFGFNKETAKQMLSRTMCKRLYDDYVRGTAIIISKYRK